MKSFVQAVLALVAVALVTPSTHAQSPAPPSSKPADAPEKTGSTPASPAPVVTPDPATAQPPQAPLTDTDRFRRGKNHFEFGDCQKVVEALQDLTVANRVSDESMLIDIHRMLGVCYFQVGNKPLAERELTALLLIDDDYILDSFLTPPPIVELFGKLRIKVKRMIEDFNGDLEPRKPAKSIVIEREVVEQETPFASIFVPMGYGQFVNGEPIKASLFGGLQLTTLLVNLAAFATVQTIGVVNGGTTFAPDNPDSRLLMDVFGGASVVAGVALVGFGLVYAYSVADAWWNWVPRREISRTEDRREATKEDQKRLRSR